MLWFRIAYWLYGVTALVIKIHMYMISSTDCMQPRVVTYYFFQKINCFWLEAYILLANNSTLWTKIYHLSNCSWRSLCFVWLIVSRHCRPNTASVFNNFVAVTFTSLYSIYGGDVVRPIIFRAVLQAIEIHCVWLSCIERVSSDRPTSEAVFKVFCVAWRVTLQCGPESWTNRYVSVTVCLLRLTVWDYFCRLLVQGTCNSLNTRIRQPNFSQQIVACILLCRLCFSMT